MRRRMGRPGLLGAMARTAVVAGTATAVSGRVQRAADERLSREQYAAQAEQQAIVDQAAAQLAAQQAPPPTAQTPPPPPPQAPAVDRIAQLTALADLKAQGILTEAEFAAEKARVLNS